LRKALTESLPQRTRQMLLAANVFMVIVIVADLFYLTNMISVDLPSFTLVNLLVLGLGLWSFRVKRDLKAGRSKGSGREGGSGDKDPNPEDEKT